MIPREVAVFAIVITLSSCSLASDHVRKKEEKYRDVTWGDTAQECCPGDAKSTDMRKPEYFTCQCPSTHYPERIFQPGSKFLITTNCKRRPIDYCIEICHPTHTYACTEMHEEKSAICHCLPEYTTESNCFEVRNPCTDEILGSSSNGNMTCRVSEDNLCIPEYGTHRYWCVCGHPARA
ncbi:unnamed protein product, partial [Dibothriocephalus latus]